MHPGQRRRESQQAVDSSLLRRQNQHGTPRPGRRLLVGLGEIQRPVLRQDRPLEHAQRGSRFDPELLDEGLAGRSVDGQCVGLPARSIKREHQLLPEPLAEGMGGDELLQLTDELRVAAERELGVDPSFDRRQPNLLEPLDRGPGERLVREIGERATAPKREGLPEKRCGLLRLSSRPDLSGALRQPLEAMQVELAGGDPDDISGRACFDRGCITQEPTQLRDLPLHLCDRRDRSGPTVEVVRESLDGYDAIRARVAGSRASHAVWALRAGSGRRSSATAIGPRIPNSSIRRTVTAR